MKKKLLFLLFLFAAVVSVRAQQINAGLVAGLSTSQVSGDNLGGFDKAGLAIGGLAMRRFSEKYSGQFEICYVGKGSRKAPNPEKGDFDEYRLNLHYIEVPVLFRYHYKKKFVFEAGPAFGTLIASSEEDEFGPLPDARPFYRTEASFIFGFDYIVSPHVVLNIRESNSVLPIRKHLSGAVYMLNRGQYNTVIEFTFRYYLREL